MRLLVAFASTLLTRANSRSSSFRLSATSEFVGCPLASCSTAGTRLIGTIPIPTLLPRRAWSWAFPANAPAITGLGCVTNAETVVCSIPLETVGSTWSGLVSLSAIDGSENFNSTAEATVHCDVDSSLEGRGSALPLVSYVGQVVTVSGSSVSLLDASGASEWQHHVGVSCDTNQTFASVSLTNQTLTALEFVAGGLLFTYLADGTPLASLYLRANATMPGYPSAASTAIARFLPHADGIYFPIGSLQPNSGLRAFYVSRFYHCGIDSCAIEGLSIAPSSVIGLIAMEVHSGIVDRMRLPWPNVATPIALPAELAACTPDAPASPTDSPVREILAVAGPLLLSDSTLIVALTCSKGASATHIYAFNVAGDEGAVPLWNASIDTATPPSLLLDPSARRAALADGVIWLTPSGPRGVRIVARHTNKGVLLVDAVLGDVVKAGRSDSCSLISELSADPTLRLELASPPVGGDGPLGEAVVLLPADALAAGGQFVWSGVIAVNTSSVAMGVTPTLLWCSQSQNRIAGAIAVATADSSDARNVSNARIVFVDGSGVHGLEM